VSPHEPGLKASKKQVALAFQGLDVGHRLGVQLTRTDVERGFIDFKKVG